MTDKKKEPIVFLLPISLKDREFAVAFDKHISDVKASVAIDMEFLEPKQPDFQSRPTSGIASVLALYNAYNIRPRPIKIYIADTNTPKRKRIYDPL